MTPAGKIQGCGHRGLIVKLYLDFDWVGVGVPSTYVVQGSTALRETYSIKCLL